MQGQITAQLWVEGDGENVPLANGDGVPIHLRQYFHAFPDLLHPRSPNEHRIEWGALERQLSLEGRQLTTECITAHVDVQDTEMVSGQHDHSCTGAQDGLPAPDEIDERLAKALTLHAEPNGGGLAAWNDQRIDALEILRRTDLADVDAKASETLRVGLESALEGEDADERHCSGAGSARSLAHYQPRFWSSPPLS